jgi:hypothetical protein
MGQIAWWQTLIISAAGGVLALGGQWWITLLQARHEERRRAGERGLARNDRREDFEREHLTALRDCLTTVYRDIVNGVTDERHAVDAASLRAQIGLALDGEIRSAAQTTNNVLAEYSWTGTDSADFVEAMGKAGNSMRETQALIHARIRTLYSSEQTA